MPLQFLYWIFPLASLSVARHDDRPLIVWIFDHCLEYQLGVYVALGLAIAAISDGLKTTV